MVKSPIERLSDLQLLDIKVTLNHLGEFFLVYLVFLDVCCVGSDKSQTFL